MGQSQTCVIVDSDDEAGQSPDVADGSWQAASHHVAGGVQIREVVCVGQGGRHFA